MIPYNPNLSNRHRLTGFRKEAVDKLLHSVWGGPYLERVRSRNLPKEKTDAISEQLIKEIFAHAASSKRQACKSLQGDLRKLFKHRRQTLLFEAGDVGAINLRNCAEELEREKHRCKEIIAEMGYTAQTPSVTLYAARLAYRGELQERVKVEFKRLARASERVAALPNPDEAAKILTKEANDLALRVSQVRDAKDQIDPETFDALEVAIAGVGKGRTP